MRSLAFGAFVCRTGRTDHPCLLAQRLHRSRCDGFASGASARQSSKGVVLGFYEPSSDDNGKSQREEVQGTPSFRKFDQQLDGLLTKTLKATGYHEGKLKKGKTRTLHSVDETYGSAVLVSLGPAKAGLNHQENWDESRENVRIAAASAAVALRQVECVEADIDTCGDAEAMAEGALLKHYAYDELKDKKKRKPHLRLSPLSIDSDKRADGERWERGVLLADGQNYARTLMETPSNLKLPRMLAERISEDLSKVDGVRVTVRDEKWAAEKEMGSFLAVSQGSAEPLRLLEISFSGGDGEGVDVALVGKGITFDTGGISIKPSGNMDLMRGDMGGAACTAAAIKIAAQLRLPVNLLGVIPICENMPSGSATRPGDVVRSMSGKTIQIDNTDAEGRLILCDALWYAQEEFKPKYLIDLATLTGAIRVALGSSASGCFTNDQTMWETMLEASVQTGDRVWRMPLFRQFAEQMTTSHLADLNNISNRTGGGACTAAGFLWEFIKKDQKWMHMDIAGVSENKDEVPYLGKGFSGRPTRTLVEFFKRIQRVSDLSSDRKSSKS